MKDKFTPGRSYLIVEPYDPNEKHRVKLSDWTKWTLIMLADCVLLTLAMVFKDEIDEFSRSPYFHAFIIWLLVMASLYLLYWLAKKLYKRLGFIILRFRKFVKK